MSERADDYLGMYEYHDEENNSHKYYEIARSGVPGRFVLRWGRIGAKPQEKGCDEHEAVAKAREKLTKGYKLVRGEVAGKARPAPEPKRERKVNLDDVWDELDKKASGT